MERTNNYAIQARQAKERFLGYNQETLITKLKLRSDEEYLYPILLGQTYRIHRKTGDIRRQVPEGWVDGNSFEEVLTLLDLVCDSREDRHLSFRWKNMLSFGQMFHQNLLESGKDPWALRFQDDPEGLRRACIALGGQPFPNGDVAYTIEVFDGLPITVQLWFGDEEFPPNLRFLWDENALMYLRYETMYYARGLLLDRITEQMA